MVRWLERYFKSRRKHFCSVLCATDNCNFFFDDKSSLRQFENEHCMTQICLSEPQNLDFFGGKIGQIKMYKMVTKQLSVSHTVVEVSCFLSTVVHICQRLDFACVLIITAALCSELRIKLTSAKGLQSCLVLFIMLNLYNYLIPTNGTDMSPGHLPLNPEGCAVKCFQLDVQRRTQTI